MINHDFAGYYRQEIDSRKELSYPPFQRMVQFEVKAKTESEAFAKVGEVAVALSSRFNRDWVRVWQHRQLIKWVVGTGSRFYYSSPENSR